MSRTNLTCRCGATLSASGASDGDQIRCSRCGRSVRLKRVRLAEQPLSRAKARPGTAFRERLTHLFLDLRSHRQPSSLGSVVAFLSYAYLASSVLITACMWTLGDAWWPGTVLLFIGRWIFLTPLAVLIPAALFAKRKALVPLAIAALVFAGPVMGARVGWRKLLPSPAGAKLRVVSFNADGGARLSFDLKYFLDELKPDIVVFQECKGDLQNAITALPEWHSHAEREVCMMTRFPIAATAVMDRSALERIEAGGTGIGGSGDVVRYSLQTPAGMISFTNLHLETPRKGLEGLLTRFSSTDVRRLTLNTQLRDFESDLARSHVNAGASPTIVAGDFNTPVESRIFRRHWSGLRDAFSTAGTGLGMTKYNGWIRVRIDHVLTDDNWAVAKVQIGGDAGSDHRPLIVDLVRRQDR